MRHPITKEYLDGLRQALIAAEEDGDSIASAIRDEYRQACAAAYSSGILIFKPSE